MGSKTTERHRVLRLEADAGERTFADDVREGLGTRPKILQPKYFYDALGSHLFEAICHLPEYYPTEAEAEILEARGDEIAEALDAPARVVELGSGSSTKTRHLLEALLERQPALHYLPVDISASMLERSSRELTQVFAGLRVTALAGDFDQALAHLAAGRGAGESLSIFFLGSTIGNHEPEHAIALMQRIRGVLRNGDSFLLGTDLKKSEAVLVPAYDDALGVTASFNLNLLVRINRELGGTFDLEHFRHRALYNAEEGRIEMHLVSQVAHTVTIGRLGMTVAFEAGETIHTENSYKYDLDQISEFARGSGFELERTWFDTARRFGVHLLRAAER